MVDQNGRDAECDHNDVNAAHRYSLDNPKSGRRRMPSRQPGIAAKQSQTDSVAVCALVFGILGILSCFTLFSIAGVVCGHIARKRALENPTASSNAGMALTGIITGYVGIVLSVLVVIVYFLFIAAAVASEM